MTPMAFVEQVYLSRVYRSAIFTILKPFVKFLNSLQHLLCKVRTEARCLLLFSSLLKQLLSLLSSSPYK
jgi:hypothetical protein